jgi:glycosyltransferase involved in cell wall biosynthesis
MYRAKVRQVQHKQGMKPKVILVYEGRLGSARADSTYVIENARIFSNFAEVEILVSRRTTWSIPLNLHNEFHIVELGEPFNPKNLIQSLRGQLAFGMRIRRYLKESNYAHLFVIFHDWWPLQPLHGIRRRHGSLKLILEVHNQIPLRGIYPHFFRHIDLFIATNRIKYVELNRIFPQKVILERNCVRLKRYEQLHSISFKIARELNEFRKCFTFVVGYTGSFGPEKNPQLLTNLPKSLPNVGFVFVGNLGSDQKRELESIPNVLILGPQTLENIPSIQISCDALLITLDPNNKTSRLYTSTMKLMEYVAARRPIIAPDVESINDLLDKCEYYTYQANSVSECTDAIKDIMTDIKSRKGVKMPQPIRLDGFSWEKRNMRILNKLVSMNSSG